MQVYRHARHQRLRAARLELFAYGTRSAVRLSTNARTHTPEQVKQIASASEKNTPPGLRKLRALRRADRDWGERTGVVRHLGRDQAFHAEGGVGGRVRRRGGCTPAHICAVITGSEPTVFTPDNSCKKPKVERFCGFPNFPPRIFTGYKKGIATEAAEAAGMEALGCEANP